jgi:hypothetical protein
MALASGRQFLNLFKSRTSTSLTRRFLNLSATGGAKNEAVEIGKDSEGKPVYRATLNVGPSRFSFLSLGQLAFSFVSSIVTLLHSRVLDLTFVTDCELSLSRNH